MKRIYLLPNLVTTANLFCGFYSIVATVHHDFEKAAWAIVAAGVFDLLDGRIARLAKATSRFGIEYDSLSDLMSFGIAPSILIYLWTLEPFGRLGWLAAFLFIVCGALRLARYNVFGNEVSGRHFQGLPIPAAAGMIVSFIIFNLNLGWPSPEQTPYYTLGLTLALASLMVSTVKFPSFKEFNWRSKASFGYLLITVMILVLVAVRPEITLFGIGVTYISAGLFMEVYSWLKGTPRVEVKNIAKKVD